MPSGPVAGRMSSRHPGCGEQPLGDDQVGRRRLGRGMAASCSKHLHSARHCAGWTMHPIQTTCRVPRGSMKLAIDVHFDGEGALAAAVAFDAWDAPEATRTYTSRASRIEKARPGELDLRGLPCTTYA